MNQTDRKVLEQQTINQYQVLRMKAGLYNVIHQKEATISAIIYLILAIIGWNFFPEFSFFNKYEFLAKLYGIFVQITYILVIIVIGIVFLIFLGTPLGAKKIHDDLWRIGLTNHAGESPLLIRKYKEKNKIIMEFDSCGISLKEWQDKEERIETALNIYILKIIQGKNRKRILLYAVSGEQSLPDILHWQNTDLNEKDFKLVLGQSLGGKVTVDLTKVPHILIGGSTGNGKSVFLKSLLMQCIKKNAEVYIADFKGGVDFTPIWHKKCTFIMKEQALLDTLTTIIYELKHRKFLLKDCGCANISEFNKRYDNHFKRIIFACDEVAELLDKTGLSKDQKELISKIEQNLSTIARQGRAFGIHLILATQRPDANILSGQIKNNLDYRVCGRADNILSTIILDNTDAANKIPKDSQGLFLNHEGVLFRGYLFDESKTFVE